MIMPPPPEMSMEYTSHFAPPVPPHKPKPLPSSIGEERSLKCVLLEDGVVGKTRLLVSYTTYGYPTRYIPTAFYDFSALVKVRNTPIKLQFCDTAGQDEFDKLRHFCYPKTDVVILCFIEVSPSSFQNISERWISEIETHCSNVLLVLVGTQYNCTVLEED